MIIERSTFKQLIDLMKAKGLDADKALETAEEICGIFEKLEEKPLPHPKQLEELEEEANSDAHLIGKRPLSRAEIQAKKDAATNKLLEGGGGGAGPRTGKPGTRVPGGYFGRDGRFVPEGKPVTATYDSSITPEAPK